MQRQIRRFIWALGISLCGFFGSVIWYHATRDNSNANKALKPLARLNEAQNEVQRKPLQRVIWESVAKNDELYTGEAIRTAPDAEAQLFFLKTGTTVHLDPDSLIVLEETDKGLSLDFLQGNLFVQSSKDGKDTGELTLKTGDGKIHLKSADMSLSKNQNGKVDLEVHRGSAELDQGSKKTALDQAHSAEVSENGVNVRDEALQIGRPAAGETLFLNLSKGDKLEVEWKALPPEYEVSFEVGSSRSTLAAVAGVHSSGADGHQALTSKPGRFYLRLRAVSKTDASKTLASTIVPFTVQPKSSPSLLEPRQDASVILTEPGAATAFHWLNRNKFSAQAFEVSNDAQFKNVKLRKDFGSDTNTFATPLEDGTYFWRVTGFLRAKGKAESLSSTINKFAVTSHIELKAPLTLFPKAGQHLGYGEVASGLTLRWQTSNATNAVEAELEFNNAGKWQTLSKETSDTSELHVAQIKPGSYRWRARTVGDEGSAGKVSEEVPFTVENLPRLEWADPQPIIESRYTSSTPSIEAHWLKTASAASYRFKVTKDGSGSEGEWQSAPSVIAHANVSADGSYQVLVEALNDKNSVIAQSELKTFHVMREPLLPAPRWAAQLPEQLKSDGKGNLTLNWEKVDGAKGYMMVLESLDGKVLEQKNVSRTTASLQKLKPGAYNVHLQSVDGSKRPGLEGEKRALNVPATSDIRAPKFKTMKVK